MRVWKCEGMGAIGLITYMRTDSLRISDDARRDGCAFIKERFGDAYLPEKPRTFKSRSSAQDAHEAIRPTMPGAGAGAGKGLPDLRPIPAVQADLGPLHRQPHGQLRSTTPAKRISLAGKYVFKASGYSVKL